MNEKSEQTERTPEFKIRMVEKFLNGECQAVAIQREYGINKGTFKWWVHTYKTFGPEGFSYHRNALKYYPPELKKQVCEEYIAGGSSLVVLCAKYKIRSVDNILLWLKKYNAHEELETQQRRRAALVGNARPTTHAERIEIAEWCITNNQDYIKAAQRYRVPYSSVRSWVLKYKEHGPAGLEDRRGRQKPIEELSEAERQKRQIKQLESKNRLLQIENDLLKKLAELERGQI